MHGDCLRVVFGGHLRDRVSQCMFGCMSSFTVADMDYSSFSEQIIGPFGDQNRRGCVTVNITDDDNPELSEDFNGVLEVVTGMGPPPELVTISPATTTVNIEDDDGTFVCSQEYCVEPI